MFKGINKHLACTKLSSNQH